MTYLEIRTALKSFQAQGHTVPALNSKKEVLENALAEILASITPEIIEDTIAPEVEPVSPAPEIVEVATAIAIEVIPQVDESPAANPVRITPEHPAVELAKVVEITLVWSIAIVRSLIRFSTPYLIRFGEIALRAIVTSAIYFQVLVMPKIKLVLYQLATWVLQLINNRELVQLKLTLICYQLATWGIIIATRIRTHHRTRAIA